MPDARLQFRSLPALNGRLGADWGRERRDTLLLLGAVLLAILPSVGHLPLWCSAAFMLLFSWRIGLMFSGRPLPGPALRLITALACCAGVVAEYGTLFGREPGVAMLALFLGLKLMEMRAHRDLMVLISLCFFLLLTSFFSSQSPVSAILALIATAGLVLALLTLNYGRAEAPLQARLRLVSLMLMQALPLAVLLFILFPRLSGPLWGLPSDAHTGRTGMSSSMQPGQIASLIRNEEVAFRVQFFTGAPALAQMYWRGPTLGHYDGRVWTAVRHDTGPPPRPELSTSPDGSRIRYQMTLEPHGDHWLLGLEHVLAPPKAAGLEARIDSDHQWRSASALTQRLRYQAVSDPAARIGLNENPLSLQAWLQLPAGHHQRTLELAARWQRETPDPAVLVQRALDMFRTGGFRYTPEPPRLPDRMVDRFLFETRAGYCEHYASAFVVLMRALDIPARVVTGYLGAEQHPSGEYWIVRQADAHAWSEVWLAGRGWVRVDPTAAVAPERIDRGALSVRQALGTSTSLLPVLDDHPVLRQWRLSIDAMTNQWNQWVLNYDRTQQSALISRLGLDATDPRVLTTALAIVLTLGIGIVALITLRPPAHRDPVRGAWERFCERLAAAGLPRQTQETPLHYLSRISPRLSPTTLTAAEQIVHDYCRLRYDQFNPNPEEVRRLRRMIDAFKVACILAAASIIPLSLPSSAMAQTVASEPGRVWLQREVVQSFINDLTARHGFERVALERIIAAAQPSATVLRLVAPAPAGFKRSWTVYRKRFIEPIRIRAGLRFWNEHAATLARAEAQYGVPAAIIVSIIGIETLYGSNMGDFRVVDALATLGFEDPRRGPYFREELEHFLLLARDGGFDPLTLRGSFAGAIGMPQFMPGSIRRHAVDFDGDGAIDLRANAADAIGSVAQFLRNHGWQPGEPTHHPVELEDEVMAAPAVALGIPPRLPASDLAQYGLRTPARLASDEKLILVDLPDGDAPTRYLLGTANFNAITSYNRSYFYAMAVIDFAEVLTRERSQARTAAQARPKPQPGKRSIDR
ncbi:MAG: lytic murein transglycosylase B [Burkholderiaceae bacterium]